MACAKLPTVPVPAILDTLLPSAPSVHVPPISINGLKVCCNVPPFSTPPIIFPIGSIPGAAVILQPLIAGLLQVIGMLNSALDAVQVKCPLE